MLARAVRARRGVGTGALGSLCPWGERPAGVAGGAAPRSCPFLFPRARRVLWSLPPAPGRARHVPRVCRACADGPRASEQASCSVRSVRWVVRTCGAGSWRIGPVSLASGSGSEVFPALRNQPRLMPGGTRAGRLGAHWTARWPSGRSWVRTSTLCRLVGGTGLSAGQRAGSRQASSAGQPCST